jgi:aryl-alcohol dehydrogenase-like predicted oxidoreductase
MSAGLANYYLLGRSGLRVSPLCLGAMTFGNNTWGCDEVTSRAMLDRYCDAGGNFIDTANLYAGGDSEEILGRIFKESGKRDRIVLATKFTFGFNPDDPNASGNGRKNIVASLEASLRRLQTDYVDLYWMHAWDMRTPAEEVMATLDTLVRQGKIRYIGLSDAPAWYVARAQTVAEWRGWTPPCALQLEYSLVARDIEREFVDAARELGLGICPWSPLASGLLAGKYKRSDSGDHGAGRLQTTAAGGNPVFAKLTERNFKIVDELLNVAKELNRSPAQVAINWATMRPGVVSTLIGATRMDQLEDNLAALDFSIPPELAARLDAVGRPAPGFPYQFFHPPLSDRILGNRPVYKTPPWY